MVSAQRPHLTWGLKVTESHLRTTQQLRLEVVCARYHSNFLQVLCLRYGNSCKHGKFPRFARGHNTHLHAVAQRTELQNELPLLLDTLIIPSQKRISLSQNAEVIAPRSHISSHVRLNCRTSQPSLRRDIVL